ncbi:hypothetical protein VPH526E571_0030 [Vibrio phage 526E57-1]
MAVIARKVDSGTVKSFPKLMKSTGSTLVILFESEKSGTVVQADNTYAIGHHSKCWTSHKFTDLIGSIELVNE